MVNENDTQSTATEERTETPPAPPEPTTPQKTDAVTAPIMIADRIGDVRGRTHLTENYELLPENEAQLLEQYTPFQRIGEVVSVSVVNHPIATVPNDENFEDVVTRQAENLNVLRSDLFFVKQNQGNSYQIFGRFVIVTGVA